MNNILKYKKVICIVFVMVFVIKIQATEDKETFIKIAQNFLLRQNYALKYKSYLYSKDGKEIELTKGDAIVLRSNLTLFTQTDELIYIINPEGSLKVNFKTKKIAYSNQPLTKEEKDKLITDLNEKSHDILLSKINKCDSFSVNTINDMQIYSTYNNYGDFSKTECWVDKNNNIKEIRYFFSEGDFIYQKIVYQDYKLEDANSLIDFSNYFSIKDNKVVLTEKYKDYAFYIK